MKIKTLARHDALRPRIALDLIKEGLIIDMVHSGVRHDLSMAKDHTSNPSPTLDCCGAVADPCRVNNFPDSHERPNDDVQFGSGEEPDWDRFLESHFHLWLAGGRDGEPPTPLIKTNPRINDGEPYIVLTSGAPDPAGNSGELLQRHITGRQALSLAPPGVSLLVDDHSLRAKSDEIAYLRSELERIGPDNLVLDDLMFTFGFTAEDLEANLSLIHI